MKGLLQAAVGVAGVSIEHLKLVAPAEVKVNSGVVSLIVPVGPPVIVGAGGGVVSTVNDWEATVLVFPRVSEAVTWKVWARRRGWRAVKGLLQAAVGVAGVSIEHLKLVAPAEVKVN